MSDFWPGAVKVTPQWRIEVYRPNWTSLTASPQEESLVVSFFPTDGLGVSVGMTYGPSSGSKFVARVSQTGCPVTSFSYETDLGTPATDFKFTLLPFDDFVTMIQLHDMVYFYDDTYGRSSDPEFIGMVMDRRMSSRMGNNGMVRGITISGKSIAMLVTDFPFVLDMRVVAGSGSDVATATLQANLQQKTPQNGSLIGVAKTMRDNFVTVMAKAAESAPQGVLAILQNRLIFIDGGTIAAYPMVFSLYQAQDNTLWELLQNLVQSPWNEGFFRFTGKNISFNLRQTPYLTPAGWAALDATKITLDPLYLEGFDLGNSTGEAYTVFGSVFPGSGIDNNKATGIPYYRQALKVSPNLLKYGYKQMIVTRNFIDRSVPSNYNSTLLSLMETTNQQLSDVYLNLPDMFSGTIQTKPMRTTPVIGTKVTLQGVDFYIENVSRSWQMGESFGVTLRVTRGGRYAANGVWAGPGGADMLRKLGL